MLESRARPDSAGTGRALVRNHAFIDGNKRTSAVVTRLFLKLNGRDLVAGAAERADVWTALAAGKMTEEDLADWIRQHIAKR